MKTARGWWALAGLIVLPLILYVGAYYAMVRPREFQSGFGPIEMAPGYPSAIHGLAIPFFGPIHRFDRWLRPQVWDPPSAVIP